MTPPIDTYTCGPDCTEDCACAEKMGVMRSDCLVAAGFMLAILVFFVLACVAGCNQPAHAAELTDQTAALAIIGEAEGESQTCRIAIAETIRRRGSLKGVYGISSPRVVNRRYSQNSLLLARAAWWDSRYTNYSKQADGWGNAQDLIKFRQCKWFRNCEIVARIDGTFFWKQVRNG